MNVSRPHKVPVNLWKLIFKCYYYYYHDIISQCICTAQQKLCCLLSEYVFRNDGHVSWGWGTSVTHGNTMCVYYNIMHVSNSLMAQVSMAHTTLCTHSYTYETRIPLHLAHIVLYVQILELATVHWVHWRIQEALYKVYLRYIYSHMLNNYIYECVVNLFTGWFRCS